MIPEFRIPGVHFGVLSYAIVFAVAALIGLKLSRHLSGSDKLLRTRISHLWVWSLLSAVVGAKGLMMLFDLTEPQRVSTRPVRLGSPDAGSMYFGGFLAAVGTSLLLARRWGVSWWRIADVSAPGLALAQSIGRLGCFLAGCCWGKPTDSWIGVTFTRRAHELYGVPVDTRIVPTQLIEAAANLTILFVLLAVRKRQVFDGQTILAYVILYSAARFIIEFWRADPRGQLLGLSASQFISVLLLVPTIAIGIIAIGSRRGGV